MKLANTAVLSATLGALFGATTSSVNWLSTPADAGGSPVADTGLEPIARVASLILDSGWAWAGLAVAIGWLINLPVRGAVAALVALLAATAAYLLMDHVLRDQPLALDELRYWAVASVLLAPGLGAVGASIRRPGVVGLLASLAVPAGATVQMILQPPGGSGLTVSTEAVWARGIVLAAAAALAGVVMIRFVAASALRSEAGSTRRRP